MLNLDLQIKLMDSTKKLKNKKARLGIKTTS